MSDRHCSDDDLVARLFGLGNPDEQKHLDTCESCSHRWDRIRRTHQNRRIEGLEVKQEVLDAQRRAIYARIERNPRKARAAWFPLPVAAVLLMIIMFTVFKPAAQKQSVDVISDDKALQDVFNVGARLDPAGMEPVQSLFEVQK